MQYPTLSVIMSNYNHACYLPTALDAILSQSYQPKEVIIVDDASKDNSVEILESYLSKHKFIKIIRNEINLGVAINGNRLLEYATGDYIYGAAADDKVLPGLFEKSMNLLKQYPQAGLSSGLALRMNIDGENVGLDYLPIVSKKSVYFSPEQCSAMICKYDNWIHSSATIFRRDALLSAGGFIPELRSYCDVFAGFVIALRHGVCYIPEPLSAFRITGSNYRSIFERQPELLFEHRDNIISLINSSYVGLFPNEFTEEIGRTATYNYNRVYCLSPLDVYNERLKHIKELRTPLSGFLRGTMHLLLHFEKFISKIYIFVHSRRKIYYPVFRKILKFSHSFGTRKYRQFKI